MENHLLQQPTAKDHIVLPVAYQGEGEKRKIMASLCNANTTVSGANDKCPMEAKETYNLQNFIPYLRPKFN